MSNSAEPRTGNGEPPTETRPRVLTNMVFWQSGIWTRGTDSIYDMENRPKVHTPSPVWVEAAKLLGRQSHYDVVVTMGARESLGYGLLCALLLRPSKQVMCEVFIDEPHSKNLLWRFKVALYRFVAQRALGVLTNSSAEVESVSERFRISRSMVRYVPMHSNIHAPELSEQNDGFILSAGRTRRDYATLLQAAPQIGVPILIIAGIGNSFPASLPKNASILRDVSRSVYLDYLRRCSLVVLPLLLTERATGQVVLLEAMAFGKPAVASRAPGTTDLIRHGENGILVEPGNAEKLAGEVRRLIDQPDLARQLGMNALNDVKNAYTFDIHAKAKLKAVRELWRFNDTSSK